MTRPRPFGDWSRMVGAQGLGLTSVFSDLEEYSQAWLALRLFFWFRLGLAGLFVWFGLSAAAPSLFGSAHPDLFRGAGIAYFAAVAIAGIPVYQRVPGLQAQALLMVLTDSIAIVLLMHASGGVQSGLGILLAASVAGGSLLTGGRTGLLFAAIAALALLIEQGYTHLYEHLETPAYTQAGFLGLTVFAVAVLGHVLAQRARQSAELASRREFDLANLTQLNDYIIRHSRTGVLVVDASNRIRHTNQAAARLIGKPDLGQGQSLHRASLDLAKQLLRWRRAPDEPAPPFPVAGGTRQVQASFARLGGNPEGGILISLQDHSAQAQQAQQEKLSALGRLTASIAHEIRNPLSAISHAGQLLEESPDLARSDRRLLQIVQTNATRVNEIIENVLQLSRRTGFAPGPVRVLECLQEFAENFGLGHDWLETPVRVRANPAELTIEVDRSQLHQILTILCENSVAHSGRDAENLQIEIAGGIDAGSATPYIEVSDNGSGIPQETVERIFEPFFTTSGQGTGLGLYIAKELSAVNRARLEYRAPARGGSRFRLLFPGIKQEEGVVQ